MTTREYVVTTLRQSILEGAFPGGAKLRQVELAQQLGVSTTPVREALRELAAEGLVVLDARRGAIVKPLDLADAREIYELRIALAPLMITRVIDQVTEADIATARDLHEQMSVVRDTKKWAELNRHFHAQFYRSQSGSRLGHLLGGLRDSAAIYVARSLATTPEQVVDANAEHAQLIEYFAVGDAQKAIELTVRHYSATLHLVLEAFEGSHADEGAEA